MISSRRRIADGLAVTIRPQFDPRVNPAMVCSIPPSSRASIGVNSTPSDGATAWIAANWAVPEVMEGFRMTAARVIAGTISLSGFSHFPLRDEAAAGGVEAIPVDRRQLVASRKCDDQLAMHQCQPACCDDQATLGAAHERSHCALDLARVADID